MRIKNNSIFKRATLLLIAIFSCAQITLGVFLIAEKNHSASTPKINADLQNNIIELANALYKDKTTIK